MEYDLKLRSGKVATWVGENGEETAKRYADAHRQSIVVAYRPTPHGLFMYNHNIKIVE